jgi:hypothetical protein
VFFVLYGNVQVALAFLLSCLFRSTRVANILIWLWVLGSSIFADYLLKQVFRRDPWWTALLECIPSFGVYRCTLMSDAHTAHGTATAAGPSQAVASLVDMPADQSTALHFVSLVATTALCNTCGHPSTYALHFHKQQSSAHGCMRNSCRKGAHKLQCWHQVVSGDCVAMCKYSSLQ